jgi:hypothetical protein
MCELRYEAWLVVKRSLPSRGPGHVGFRTRYRSCDEAPRGAPSRHPERRGALAVVFDDAGRHAYSRDMRR